MKREISLLKAVGGEITTKSFAVGGGEWSIEIYTIDGDYLFELVGSNGTREGETADNLWNELSHLMAEAMR